MDRSVPRIGAWAGFIAVIGIMGYHIVLMLIAGPRVSGSTDAAAIAAYYSNESIAILGVGAILVLVPFTVFLVALREVTGQTSTSRFPFGDHLAHTSAARLGASVFRPDPSVLATST